MLDRMRSGSQEGGRDVGGHRPIHNANTYTIEHALAYFSSAGLTPSQCGPTATAMSLRGHPAGCDGWKGLTLVRALPSASQGDLLKAIGDSGDLDTVGKADVATHSTSEVVLPSLKDEIARIPAPGQSVLRQLFNQLTVNNPLPWSEGPRRMGIGQERRRSDLLGFAHCGRWTMDDKIETVIKGGDLQ
jgi:hypothetical protein